MRSLLLVALFAASAHALCPDSCSGHGTCGAEDKCSCYANWQGANCQDRTCPFSYAFVDSFNAASEHGLTAADNGHWYAECSNKGLCDRKTGQCDCFEGYEGKACRRSACPNGCSGHGTCELQNELGVYADWDAEKIQGCKCDGGYEGPDCSLRKCPKGDDPLTHTVTGTGTWAAQTNERQEFAIFWMSGFKQAGDHTAASSTSTHVSEWQTLVGNVATREGQTITTNHQVLGAYDSSAAAAGDDVPPHEITLTFTDTNGHAWTTVPIELDAEIVTSARTTFTTMVERRTAGGACTDTSGATKTGQCLENDIEEALESLPNRVIDDVTVTVTSGTCGTTKVYDPANSGDFGTNTTCGEVTDSSGVSLWGGSANSCSQLHDGVSCGFDNQALVFWDTTSKYHYFKVVVDFTGAEVSGNQNPIEINIDRCIEPGCQPVTRGIPSVAKAGGTDATGIAAATPSATNANWRGEDMWISQVSSTDGTKEANECSDRGACDKSTGLCSCFAGYTGQMCQQQTAIV